LKTIKPKHISMPDKPSKSAVEETQMQEFINLQKQYKKTVLARLFDGARLKEVRLMVEDKKPNTLIVDGLQFSKEMLAIEHDIQQANYFDIVVEENRVLDKLKLHGLTDTDVDNLLKQNKYVTKLKKVGKTGEYIG